jgi:hypothetical protein
MCGTAAFIQHRPPAADPPNAFIEGAVSISTKVTE